MNFFVIIFFYKENTLQLAKLINVSILLNTICNLKLNKKLKIDLKKCTFKNLEGMLKTLKKIAKNQQQP